MVGSRLKDVLTSRSYRIPAEIECACMMHAKGSFARIPMVRHKIGGMVITI